MWHSPHQLEIHVDCAKLSGYNTGKIGSQLTNHCSGTDTQNSFFKFFVCGITLNFFFLNGRVHGSGRRWGVGG